MLFFFQEYCKLILCNNIYKQYNANKIENIPLFTEMQNEPKLIDCLHPQQIVYVIKRTIKNYLIRPQEFVYIIIYAQQMQQQGFFKTNLKKIIQMIIKIWPVVNYGIKHLSQVQTVETGSYLQNKQYRNMNDKQFIETICTDLVDFIMEHDVNEEYIENYLEDILDLLQVEEDIAPENIGKVGVRAMSRQIIKVMNELQNGSTNSLNNFQVEIYQPVMKVGMAPIKKYSSDDDDEGQQQDDEQSDNDEEQEDNCNKIQQQDKQNKQQQIKQKQIEQKYEQMQKEGWIIVRKK